MSKVNFFEKFAKMSLNVDTSHKSQADITKMMNKMSIKENVEIEDKFTHSSSVILTKGQYKSYNAFVYEFYPSKVLVELTEQMYISEYIYGVLNIGDKINIKTKVIDKIDEMYGIIIKNDSGIEEEIRIFKNCCIRLVFVIINNVKKVGTVVNSINESEKELKIYELPDDVTDLNQDQHDILLKLSDLVKQNKINDLKYNMVKVNFYQVLLCEYCMVLNVSKYAGKFGKITRMIEKQYLLESKTNVLVSKSAVDIKQDNVYIKKGIYKDKKGKLIKYEKGSMKLNIEALGIMIYSHVVNDNDLYIEKKITNEDIFYKDIILKDNNYFQITKVVGDKIYGTKLVNNSFIDMIISKNDIQKYVSGCCISTGTNTSTITNITNNDEYDTIFEYNIDNENDNENKEIDDDNESDQHEYETGNIDESNDLINENTEIEMKSSFKDIERINYISTTLTKQEKDIMKNVLKTLEIIGYPEDIVNVYDVINNILAIKTKIQSELELLKVTEWKESDMKYIIASVVCYDIIKAGFSITKHAFNTFISKLIKVKYFTKMHVSGSLFLRNFEESDKKCNLTKALQMSNEEKMYIKKNYKEGNIDIVIKIMIENCNKILNMIYCEVVFTEENYEIEYLPVCKPHQIKEYPKYFMTANDIVSGVEIPKTANKMVWNPETKTILKRLTSALILKCKKERNNTLKIVYEFVIENIENAPFVLMNKSSMDVVVSKLEELKYKELKRTFEMFMQKIATLVDEKKTMRNLKIQSIKQEKEQLETKRKQFLDTSKSLEDLELLMQKNMNSLKRMRL